ncbi:AN1-type zinc finger protein 1-like protein [Dinothrombium tinctorium]|uniref:AN1-type zinc finger protein 1-like protein n=1 Tax=Dinothrombium tinctorium TaxID=1965070 RepID=A0A3S3PK35_9ACAR|nr:AN1-type zinc finger protein 1-like protein [Dinothrombium tinctorium]
MAEFPNIGEHCFECKTLEHHSTISHKCSSQSELLNADSKKEKDNRSAQWAKCSFCLSKIKLELEVTHCELCHKPFCLNHRHPEGHKCVSTEKRPAEEVSKCEKKIEVKKADPLKGAKGAKNESLAKKVALMKMKQTAKGVSSIPFEERLYFKWTIGKCVDWLSNEMCINHRQATAKLNLFKSDKSFSYDIRLKELEPDDIGLEDENERLDVIYLMANPTHTNQSIIDTAFDGNTKTIGGRCPDEQCDE